MTYMNGLILCPCSILIWMKKRRLVRDTRLVGITTKLRVTSYVNSMQSLPPRPYPKTAPDVAKHADIKVKHVQIPQAPP